MTCCKRCADILDVAAGCGCCICAQACGIVFKSRHCCCCCCPGCEPKQYGIAEEDRSDEIARVTRNAARCTLSIILHLIIVVVAYSSEAEEAPLCSFSYRGFDVIVGMNLGGRNEINPIIMEICHDTNTTVLEQLIREQHPPSTTATIAPINDTSATTAAAPRADQVGILSTAFSDRQLQLRGGEGGEGEEGEARRASSLQQREDKGRYANYTVKSHIDGWSFRNGNMRNCSSNYAPVMCDDMRERLAATLVLYKFTRYTLMAIGGVFTVLVIFGVINACCGKRCRCIVLLMLRARSTVTATMAGLLFLLPLCSIALFCASFLGINVSLTRLCRQVTPVGEFSGMFVRPLWFRTNFRIGPGSVVLIIVTTVSFVFIAISALVLWAAQKKSTRLAIAQMIQDDAGDDADFDFGADATTMNRKSQHDGGDEEMTHGSGTRDDFMRDFANNDNENNNNSANSLAAASSQHQRAAAAAAAGGGGVEEGLVRQGTSVLAVGEGGALGRIV